MITVSVWLHGKPNWALPLEGKDSVNPHNLKSYGDELRNHLYDAASIIYKLQKGGWRLLKSFGSLYALDYAKDLENMEQAVEELKNLGISKHKVAIEEIKLEGL